MIRLVVHAGTRGTGWPALQAQLVAWRGPLTATGVWMHPLDSATRWLVDPAQLLGGGSAPRLDDAIKTARFSEARLLLLSSERLEDFVRDPSRIDAMASFAAELDVELVVVLVVRDQAGYLNEAYVERVSRLRTGEAFSAFVEEQTRGGRLDYLTAFKPLLHHPAVTTIMIRYQPASIVESTSALLVASGLDAGQLPTAQLPAVVPSLPGPILVAAMRILYKRMWRHGLVSQLGPTTLADAVDRLRERAKTSSWDSQPFWGWDDESATAVRESYRAGNVELARLAWDSEWSDDHLTGARLDIDLPDLEPTLVVDILDAVNEILSDLISARRARLESPPTTPAMPE